MDLVYKLTFEQTSFHWVNHFYLYENDTEDIHYTHQSHVHEEDNSSAMFKIYSSFAVVTLSYGPLRLMGTGRDRQNSEQVSRFMLRFIRRKALITVLEEHRHLLYSRRLKFWQGTIILEYVGYKDRQIGVG